jgi:glutathione peroxidase
LTAVNYKEFAALLEKYGDKGLVIMAFPCNQFAMQEPGTNAQIKEFAKSKGFTGMLMDKVKVNGAHASPVFQFLKVASGDESLVAWNFAKWLVKKDGSVHGRYGPRTNPMSLEDEIKTLLNEDASSL